MSAILPISLFLVTITFGGSFRLPDKIHLLKKDIDHDDIHPSLLRGYSSRPICYESIGCFSPTTGIVAFLDLYPYYPERTGTQFHLYTKHNKGYPGNLDYIDKNTATTTLFNPAVPTVFIVHGLGEHGRENWVIRMKNELLTSRDLNVIIVDWENGAPFGLYTQGIVNAELVSRQVARLLVLLNEVRGYDIAKTHMIGYSLGAHLAGFTGKYLKVLGKKKMGRITGLDAAGPTFEDKDERVHLSLHDADFVDVIHTSAAGRNTLKGEVGIIKPIGHADFYPNGGKKQPGCDDTSITCSHSRAFDLFIESINSDCEFTSYACSEHEEFNAGKCSKNERARLGYHSDVGNPRCVFYLNTAVSSPYCKKEY